MVTRVLFLILAMLLTSCSPRIESETPANEVFLDLIKNYDTDINLCMKRFKESEPTPDISNAKRHYNYEYEIISTSNPRDSVYEVDVIRRFPQDPLFAPPTYIRFVFKQENEDSYKYISVMNYTDGGKLTTDDVIFNAVKNYHWTASGTDYSQEKDSEFYIQYLGYAARNEMFNIYSSIEYEMFTDYEKGVFSVPENIAKEIIKNRFGVELNGSEIPEYNALENVYELPIKTYENFYSADIEEVLDLDDNIYEVKVKMYNSLSPENDSLTSYVTFKLHINGDDYRYISVDYE